MRGSLLTFTPPLELSYPGKGLNDLGRGGARETWDIVEVEAVLW